MLMEIFMRVSGRMIKLSALGYFWTPIMLDTRVSGSMICSMGKEQRLGTMEVLNILGSFTKAKSMVKEDLNGKTVVIMMETLLMASFKVSESITSQILIKPIKVSSE